MTLPCFSRNMLNSKSRPTDVPVSLREAAWFISILYDGGLCVVCSPTPSYSPSRFVWEGSVCFFCYCSLPTLSGGDECDEQEGILEVCLSYPIVFLRVTYRPMCETLLSVR